MLPFKKSLTNWVFSARSCASLVPSFRSSERSAILRRDGACVCLPAAGGRGCSDTQLQHRCRVLLGNSAGTYKSAPEGLQRHCGWMTVDDCGLLLNSTVSLNHPSEGGFASVATQCLQRHTSNASTVSAGFSRKTKRWAHVSQNPCRGKGLAVALRGWPGYLPPSHHGSTASSGLHVAEPTRGMKMRQRPKRLEPRVLLTKLHRMVLC